MEMVPTSPTSLHFHLWLVTRGLQPSWTMSLKSHTIVGIIYTDAKPTVREMVEEIWETKTVLCLNASVYTPTGLYHVV